MKLVKTVSDIEIMNFAGCFKIFRKGTGEDLGGIYPSEKEAFNAAVEVKREDLGIVVRERRCAE